MLSSWVRWSQVVANPEAKGVWKSSIASQFQFLSDEGGGKMCTKQLFITITVLFLVLGAACQPSAVDLDAESTDVAANIFATQEAQRQVESSATEAQKKVDAEATTMAKAELANQQAQATLDTNATTTSAQATQEVVDRMATTTAQVEKAEAAVTAAAALRLVATTQAEPMHARILELEADGHLSSTVGTYYRLDDFSQTWAQINWYQWWGTGHAPDNFVVRSDVEWESGSDTANWWNSGCGYIFRVQDTDNHLRAFLALDGSVRFNSVVNGNWGRLGEGYVANLDIPRGQGELMLVVQDNMISFFFNGERVYRQSYSALDSGELALTLASGTNKDFGTRCTFTNIDLYELD
jgi:hypothetical protein